ncbi:MAG TPA: SAF domain-containing protein [Natronosporangium sp.]
MSSNLAAPPEGYVMVGPTDAPRLVKQRHVRRGWVGIGVLAIVLAALGSATLFRAIGPSQSYLALAQDVPVGAQLTEEHLRVVRMNSTPGLNPVPDSQLDEVVGQYAAVPLVAGTLLSMDQLTDEPIPPPGQQLVAIGLPPDRLPGGTLEAGDPVMLVTTSRQNAEPETNPRTFPARVHELQPSAGRDDDIIVSLLVSERDGALIASLAAADRLTLVLLSEAGS